MTTTLEADVLALLRPGGMLTADTIALNLNTPRWRVVRVLHALRDNGDAFRNRRAEWQLSFAAPPSGLTNPLASSRRRALATSKQARRRSGMRWPSDNTEDRDVPTPQEHYYSNLIYLRSHYDERNAIRLTQLETEGPPPPQPQDGARGGLRWHTRHVPDVEEFARLLDLMHTEGLLSGDDVAAYKDRPAAESVAELTARVDAIDTITHAHRQPDRP